MGFITKLVKGIFSPAISQASSIQPQISARDLVSSTTSETPEAPVMGNDKKKNKGVQSLLVPSEDLYKGGV